MENQDGPRSINSFLSRLKLKLQQQPSCEPALNEPEVPAVKCQLCQDSYFVHPRKPDGRPDYSRTVICQCVRQEREKARMDRLRKYCELPKKCQTMTFDNFEVSSPLREAYEASKSMTAKDAQGFLTLMGPSNRGKTHLAVAIVQEWLKSGRLAKYTYVPLLLDELRAAYKSGGDDSYEAKYQTFLSVPLLFMDDIGVQNPTYWAQEHLDTIVNERLVRDLPTIFTVNLPLNRLPFRVASRLKRDGNRIIVIDAPEYKGGRRARGEKA